MATESQTETLVSSDIYEITEFYNQIRASTIPDVDETASVVGIFGHMNEMFMQTLQNNIQIVSETTNEVIPTRAKFAKNVLSHALNAGITNLNATPAVMTVMIYLPISHLNDNFSEVDTITGKAKFILDKNIPIMVDNFEFHLDYDVIINRIKNTNGQYIYTAMYDLFESGTTHIKQANPISDITNPYITTVMQATINNTKFVGFAARIHQVTYQTVTKNVVTNNTIENKTLTIELDTNQLAAFDVEVTEAGVTTHLTPIFNGLLDYTIEDGTWCYYDFVSKNVIRILFSRDSYIPGLNAQIVANVYVTEGSNGNFSYNTPFRSPLKSIKFNNYKGMYAYIYPLLNGLSTRGKDRKSIAELKRIIPRELSSRGAIINTTDLRNFFNSLNNDQTNLFFKKKKDNPFERMYYTYILMKKYGNIYPTNTLSLKVQQNDFIGHSGNNNLSINPGTTFYYWDHGSKAGTSEDYATLVKPTIYPSDDLPYSVTMNSDGKLVRVFEYASPFLITVDDDLISTYLMTCMNENKTFTFDSINTASDLQFISTNMQWTRGYYKDNGGSYDDKYIMTVDVIQNNDTDYNLLTTTQDANGKLIIQDNRIKMYLVLYADDTASTPYRYLEGKIINYDAQSHGFTFQFIFNTDDMMDLKNRINITGLKNCKPEAFQLISELEGAHGYMAKNTYAKLFILADFGTKAGDRIDRSTVVTADTAKAILYGDDGIGNRTEIESIIPTKSDIIEKFLRNDLVINKNGSPLNVVYIMQANESYMAEVMTYNGDESRTAASIIKYLRNNKDSEFVQKILLADEDVQTVINSYAFEDLDRYTVCNTMIINGGIDFYHDYSHLMHSTVTVVPLQASVGGKPVYREVERYDEYGIKYTELKPAYQINDNGVRILEYTIDRIPMVKKGFLNTETLVQDFIFDLEERRKYIEICLSYLEDTFDIDFKFINTWGPSRTFYYTTPSTSSYEIYANTKVLNVYDDPKYDGDRSHVVGQLQAMQTAVVLKVNGQWGYIESPYQGWIKLLDTERVTSYIDNVAITLNFEARLQSSADKDIATAIIADIKDYIEDINTINEIHIARIIQYVLNNYNEQLVYFSFLGLNQFGRECDHLYLTDENTTSVDIVPEFINVATSDDGLFTPLINITLYT